MEYDTKLFGTDGGDDSISVHPDGQVSWTAVSSDPTWIVLFSGASGTGDGEILYIVAPYVGNGEARTGTITVGDKVVYITQRAYDLSIDPKGAVVPGNNGAGEFGVSATIDAVWRAIVTEPWITLVSGYDAGTGNGTVRFVYTDNDTGKVRTGKIIVAGEVYTLEQKARQFVAVTAEAGHGGRVEGGGSYDLGAEVTLTAIPDSGYAFSYWTGAVESMENPLKVRVDVPKTYTAVFEPLPIAFESVVSGTNGVTLAWNNLAWATHYLLYRGVTSVPSSATVLADIPNTGDCTFLDDTGELEVEYWYWIEAEGAADEVMSDPMTGKKRLVWTNVKDETEVAAVFAEAADARLGERMASVEEYEAFREWIDGKELNPQAVKESTHAWPSYVLGGETLFENEPDIQIAGFTPEEGTARRDAAGFTWEIRVTVKDGESAAAVEISKIAARFEASRQPDDWSEDSLLPLIVSAKGKEGEVLLFDVTIGSETATSAFLRLGREGATVVEPVRAAKYLVVDLLAGADASAYPITYLDEQPSGGFNTDEYKTTKLVLRLIEPGAFTMGSPSGESGRNEDDETQHTVTLTKPFYIGLFEVTQKQWQLVMGNSNLSAFSGDKRPVEYEDVWWNTIRGNGGWPASSAVSADSFMGRLRARTGLAEFDLPTEAQWEYACRAGTRTAYSYGESANGDYMWYDDNSSWETHDVGTKKPNPWGLYDMHGNVWEWCLDWYTSNLGTAPVTDPKGASSGSYRVIRGGAWNYNATYGRSASRVYDDPSSASFNLGFRLARILSE